MIEVYEHNGEGYLPCLIRNDWQAALLNYAEAQDFVNIDKIEKHIQTDEVFVLLHGKAILITADVTSETIRFELIKMKEGIIYNIPQGVWHNIAMDRDTRIFICENANTHLIDCSFLALSVEQQKEIYLEIMEKIIE